MLKLKTCSQSGFTLIELLLVSVIILVLAGLSFQAYTVHKERAFHAVALQTMQQARVALAAGKVDSENFPQQLMAVVQDAPGLATQGDARQLVPGLVLPDSFRVIVRHNPACQTDDCVEDAIVCRHCKANRQVMYVKTYRMGEVFLQNGVAEGPC